MPAELRLSGATNFRPVRLATARELMRTIYRSNHFARLTEADVARLAGLGIVSVIDLRTQREQAAQPTVAALSRAWTYQSSKPDNDFVFDPLFARKEVRVEAWREAFEGFFVQMLDLYAEEFGATFQAIADNRLPMIIHCSAGKDRTGVVCALIQDLMGLPEGLIVEDYLLSGERLEDDTLFRNMLNDAKLERYAGLPMACREVMFGVDGRYISTALVEVRRRWGSVEGYLTDRLGLSSTAVDRIRSTLA